MPKWILILVAGAAVLTAIVPGSAPAAVELTAPLYANLTDGQLIFRDEFSGSRVNRSRWSTLRGRSPGYGSPYNPELEAAAYSRNNVAQRNGTAILTLRRRPARGYARYPYSSGLIHSGHSFAFKRGYVEARVRVPKCSGCWPAFWMLDAPVDRFWPPEIDIFEFFNTGKISQPAFNFHYRANGGHQQSGPATYGDGGEAGTWHTYGLRWTDSSLQVFLDGVPGPSFNQADQLPTRRGYLIFNLGLFKGNRPRSGSKMQIDWVRVWR